MSQSGEAAEQIVNMATGVTVKGVECAANLTGKGALSLATFLIAALKDQKRTKGKARMRAFQNKPTKVFVIRSRDMKTFAAEAKKYGILYAAVINKRQPDGLVDVVVNANDAARVNRIAERFALSTVEMEQIRTAQSVPDAEKDRMAPPTEKEALVPDTPSAAPLSPKAHEVDDIPELTANPTRARTENLNPSAPFFDTKEHADAESTNKERTRPSVRQQLNAIREERQAQSQLTRERSLQTTHRQPMNKKEKSKGR